MRESGFRPVVPPARADHLVGYLMSVGPVEYNAMGRAPIGWREIAAWSSMTGTPLTPWEGETLRRMSAEYLSEATRAEKPECPPPWGGDSLATRRTIFAGQFRAVLAMLKT